MKSAFQLATTFVALSLVGQGMAQSVPPESPFGVTYNIGFASEYAYRGISQSDNHPALSGGGDLTHASGWYMGGWTSTITWLEDTSVYDNSQIEVDLYAGYKAALGGDVQLDGGILRYQYPGKRAAETVSPRPHTTELYLALNYKACGIKYSQSTTNLFGVANSHGSGYLDLYANVDVAQGIQLNLHYGKQQVEGTPAADYADYKIGVTKDLGFATGTLAFIKTAGNAKAAAEGTPYADWYRGRLVASITKNF